jgi:hypothetical protein
MLSGGGGRSLDILMTPAIREPALMGIRTRELVFFGPLISPATGIFSVTVALPIYVKAAQNETFGSRPSAYPCGELCYNTTTGEKFW